MMNPWELQLLVRGIDKRAAKVSTRAAPLLMLLASHAGRPQQDELDRRAALKLPPRADELYCFPSEERLALELGASDRHVRRCLAELVDGGLLEVERGRQHESSRYFFRLDNIVAAPKIQSGQRCRSDSGNGRGGREGATGGPADHRGSSRDVPRTAPQPRDPTEPDRTALSSLRNPDEGNALPSAWPRPDRIEAQTGQARQLRPDRSSSQTGQRCPPISLRTTKGSERDLTEPPRQDSRNETRPEIARATTDPYRDPVEYIRKHLRTKTTSERDELDALMRSGRPCTYAKLGLHTREQIDAAWTEASNEQKGNAA